MIGSGETELGLSLRVHDAKKKFREESMRNLLINTKKSEFEYYKDILIHAHSGLHQETINLFSHYLPSGSRVLDIGAGAGAFSQRLADLGYQVTALDIETEKWIPKQIEFVQLNIDDGINKSLNTTEKFDAVCCLEVIEHIENPWNLLREIHSLVKPGGKLILSTPNITSFLSRLIFLIKGELHQFNEAALSHGHINPLTDFEILTIANRIGWKVLEVKPGGYLPVFDFSSFTPKSLIYNLLRGISYSISIGGQKMGWCLIFVLEKQ